MNPHGFPFCTQTQQHKQKTEHKKANPPKNKTCGKKIITLSLPEHSATSCCIHHVVIL